MNNKKYSFGNLDTKNVEEIKEMEKQLMEKYNSEKEKEQKISPKSEYIPA